MFEAPAEEPKPQARKQREPAQQTSGPTYRPKTAAPEESKAEVPTQPEKPRSKSRRTRDLVYKKKEEHAEGEAPKVQQQQRQRYKSRPRGEEGEGD